MRSRRSKALWELDQAHNGILLLLDALPLAPGFCTAVVADGFRGAGLADASMEDRAPKAFGAWSLLL